MFGMRHFGSHREDRHAAGRHGRWRPSPASAADATAGGGDIGGGDMMRAGRMLAQGDLRLLALALIAEQPRHGYEIIKVLEEKTEGWYAPSPGIVYPTLTYLEEAGYVTAQADGAKRLYTITGEGRAYLGKQPRVRRCGAGAARRRRRADALRGAARTTTAAADRGCRGWFAPRWRTCARSRPNGSRTTPTRKPRWSRCWPAPRRN